MMIITRHGEARSVEECSLIALPVVGEMMGSIHVEGPACHVKGCRCGEMGSKSNCWKLQGRKKLILDN